MVDTSVGLIESRVKVVAQEIGCPEERLAEVWDLVKTLDFPEDVEEMYKDVSFAVDEVLYGR